MTLKETVIDSLKWLYQLISIIYPLILIGIPCTAYIVAGSINIYVGSEWQHCHLNDKHVDYYLILTGIFMILPALCLNPIAIYMSSILPLIGCVNVAISCVLFIWGMKLMYDTKQLDCDHEQYDWALYMTLTFGTISCVFWGMAYTTANMYIGYLYGYYIFN